MGIGVGLAGTPASHSLTGSVPVTRAGMASGTADLQRDLGGAIMQSIFGALLTAGYAAAMAAAIAGAPPDRRRHHERPEPAHDVVRRCGDIAAQYPQYTTEITAAAKKSFLDGDQWAYMAGLVAVLLGAVLVSLKFPKKDEEHGCSRSTTAGHDVARRRGVNHRARSAGSKGTVARMDLSAKLRSLAIFPIID